jgi:hypothetical protein
MKTDACACTITDDERKEGDLVQGQSLEEQAAVMREEAITLLRRAQALFTDEMVEAMLAQTDGQGRGGSHGGAIASTNATAARTESPGIVAAPLASTRPTEGQDGNEVRAEEEESEHDNNGGDSSVTVSILTFASTNATIEGGISRPARTVVVPNDSTGDESALTTPDVQGRPSAGDGQDTHDHDNACARDSHESKDASS